MSLVLSAPLSSLAAVAPSETTDKFEVGIELKQSKHTAVPPPEFRKWLETNHQHFAKSTTQIDPNRLLCIDGQWDAPSASLKRFEIPFRKTTARRIANLRLQDTKVIIMGCGTKISQQSAELLVHWVADGGYLITTDWLLTTAISKMFPGRIVVSDAQLDHGLVLAAVADVPLEIAAGLVSKAYWKLDEGAKLIETVKDAQSLVDSPSTTKSGNRVGPLAVLFPYGKGKVLHVVGHYDNNSTYPFGSVLEDPAPVINISLRQALITNFIVAGLSH
jgi:hypothetical protein